MKTKRQPMAHETHEQRQQRLNRVVREMEAGTYQVTSGEVVDSLIDNMRDAGEMS